MSSTEPFSFDTIKNFDDHINNSIPNYDLLQEAILSISEFISMPNTTVIDIGCSTGKLLKRMKHNGRKVGIDWSNNLLPPPTLNFGDDPDQVPEFYDHDITQVEFDWWGNPSLITSIFTLQFIAKEHRERMLKGIYNSLRPDGAFIWAEKVLCEAGWQQELTTFSYYDYKKKSFTAEEIMNKEQDIRQLMRCNTSKENQFIAQKAGFLNSQLIWKFYNFECWVYKKD